jgi:CheY-like chemotaxis protein
MPRRIIAIVDDMFFASKIRATAEALGGEIVFPRTQEKALEKIREARPDLILVDLHNQRLDPIDFATALKSDTDLQTILLLGFFSHVEVELQKRASAAGFDKVIPRSVFARDLAAILASAGVADQSGLSE